MARKEIIKRQTIIIILLLIVLYWLIVAYGCLITRYNENLKGTHQSIEDNYYNFSLGQKRLQDQIDKIREDIDPLVNVPVYNNEVNHDITFTSF